VRAGDLVSFLEENVQQINHTVSYDASSRTPEPPLRLGVHIVARVKGTFAELTERETEGKQFRGRQIAQAIRRELSHELAARLAGKPVDEVAAEIDAVRCRILEPHRGKV